MMVPTLVYLNENMRRKLEEKSKELGLSMGAIIRLALHQYLRGDK